MIAIETKIHQISNKVDVSNYIGNQMAYNNEKKNLYFTVHITSGRQLNLHDLNI